MADFNIYGVEDAPELFLEDILVVIDAHVNTVVLHQLVDPLTSQNHDSLLCDGAHGASNTAAQQ